MNEIEDVRHKNVFSILKYNRKQQKNDLIVINFSFPEMKFLTAAMLS
jgi:hypothetical protein